MNRRTVLVLALVAVATWIAIVGMTDAQELKLGDAAFQVNGSPVLTAGTFGLTGTVYMSSASLAPSSSGVVLTAPASGNLVVTQLCTLSYNPIFAPVTGSTLGGLALNSDNCFFWYPGLAVPPGEVLTAENVSTTNITLYNWIGVLQP